MLEVGTGTGYTAALLSTLVGDSGRVVTVEASSRLSESASRKLYEWGAKNVTVSVGDGSRGMSAEAPYDGIIVTAGSACLERDWIDQLSDRGVLVFPFQRGLAGRICELAKRGPEEAAGVFLDQTSVGFMPLVADGVVDPVRSGLSMIGQRMSAPVVYTDKVSEALIADLKGGTDFAFLAQMIRPQLMRVRVADMGEVLVDSAAETIARFSTDRVEPDARIVQVIGDASVWREVEEMHRWWVKAGRPGTSEFQITWSARHGIGLKHHERDDVSVMVTGC